MVTRALSFVKRPVVCPLQPCSQLSRTKQSREPATATVPSAVSHLVRTNCLPISPHAALLLFRLLWAADVHSCKLQYPGEARALAQKGNKKLRQRLHSATSRFYSQNEAQCSCAGELTVCQHDPSGVLSRLSNLISCNEVVVRRDWNLRASKNPLINSQESGGEKAQPLREVRRRGGPAQIGSQANDNKMHACANPCLHACTKLHHNCIAFAQMVSSFRVAARAGPGRDGKAAPLLLLVSQCHPALRRPLRAVSIRGVGQRPPCTASLLPCCSARLLGGWCVLCRCGNGEGLAKHMHTPSQGAGCRPGTGCRPVAARHRGRPHTRPCSPVAGLALLHGLAILDGLVHLHAEPVQADELCRSHWLAWCPRRRRGCLLLAREQLAPFCYRAAERRQLSCTRKVGAQLIRAASRAGSDTNVQPNKNLNLT